MEPVLARPPPAAIPTPLLLGVAEEEGGEAHEFRLISSPLVRNAVARLSVWLTLAGAFGLPHLAQHITPSMNRPARLYQNC
jgi:hypothetical protein